jgi:hypothetical protein
MSKTRHVKTIRFVSLMRISVCRLRRRTLPFGVIELELPCSKDGLYHGIVRFGQPTDQAATRARPPARITYSFGSAVSRIRAMIWSASSSVIGMKSYMVSPRSAE